MTQRRVPATLFRGGTSKGAYFRREAMPGPRGEWDDALLALFGSPDPMQIDGIGGSHSTTSKAMVVSAGDAPGVDVDYTFAQVAVEKPVVDWGGNCGNLTFAVGSFALESGVASVDPDGPGRADLVLRNENTDSVVEQSVPVDAEGSPRYRGDFAVHGVPGTGARIRSRFLDPGGSTADSLLPTGNRTDALDVDGVGELEVSLVDATNPCVFARASDLGMTAAERPDEIDADADLLDRLERVRSAACARYGFVDDPAAATGESPGIPKMAVVGERRPYETVAGDRVGADEYDLLARIMSMQKAHHAYAVTGAMCTAVAAALPGTVPAEFLETEAPDEVVLGHPKGTMTVGVDVDADGAEVAHTRVDRTARKVMDGDLYYLPRE
jgi:2-methylaconitate cis-trans-isomerase PrpF